MKLYELVISDKEESGVDFIALVDHPAIEEDFMVFNKEQEMKFEVVNEEQRIVSGYFMIADKPIYRNDQKFGEHYVVFRPDVIKEIQLKFMSNNINRNVNIMHDAEFTLDKVIIFEHIIIDSKRKMFAPDGFAKAPDGSWFGSMYIPKEHEELFQAIKARKIKGFSVEGMFGYANEKETAEETLLKKIEEILLA